MKAFKIFFFTICISTIVFSQNIYVEYRNIKDPFIGYSKPIDIGILNFEGSSTFEKELYNKMRANDKIVKKFNIWTYEALEENKGAIGINNLNSTARSVQKKLLKEFDIKFLFSGKVTGNKIKLKIVETKTGEVVYEGEFKKSKNASALDDLITLLDENLEPKYISKGELTLSVTPADAKIDIDGKKIYNKIGIELSEGKHSIKISKDGYRAIIENINIQGNQILKKTYNLKEIYGVLNLTVEPKDANLTIYNGFKSIKQWKGKLTNEKLKPGNYIIEAIKKGYITKKRKITVKADEILNTEIFLEKEARLTTKLNVKVSPAMSKILVKRGEKIIKSIIGNLNNYKIKPGHYTLEISSNGYETKTKQINITDGVTENIDVTLKKIRTNIVSNNIGNSNKNVFIKSALIPGWGQISSGRGIGWLYTIGTVGALGYYMINLNQHNENIDIYNSAKEQYQLSGSKEDYEEYTKAYDKMKGTYKTSNVLIGVAIGIYTFNLFDALVFTPHGSKNRIAIRPNANINSNGKVVVGFTLGIKL